MTELSPAAKAVRDAVLATYADSVPKDDNLWALERASTVAALRAATDYDSPNEPDVAEEYDMGWYAGMEFIQSIADELESL